MNFAMELNGSTKKCRTMSSVLRSTSRYSGVHDISTNVVISETRELNIDAELRSILKTESSGANFPLNDVQTLAISKIIRLDTSFVETSEGDSDEPEARFRTPSSDITRPCILDMPTGSGKTVTSILGSILFAIVRDSDMKGLPPITLESTTGCIEIHREDRDRVSNRKCLAFVPKHLVGHWGSQFKIAKNIVERVYTDWSISVYLNKKASDVHVGEKEVAMIICDNSHGPKKIMDQRGEFYPSVCFDESGERSANVLNQIFDGVDCGRFIMCSADVSGWGKIVPRKHSILRNVFPSWNICLDRTFYSHTSSYDLSEIHKTVACLSMASVFHDDERDMVVRGSGSALDDILLYTSTIRYFPSLLECLGVGSGVDLVDMDGVQVFENRHGVRISGCKTLGDIVKAIEEKIRTVTDNRYLVEKLNNVSERVRSIHGEECPICLEPMADTRVLQPCLHFMCPTCSHRIERKCPICRCDLAGYVGVSHSLSIKRPAVSFIGGPFKRLFGSSSGPSGPCVDRDIGDLYFEEIEKKLPVHPVRGGVVSALKASLETIKCCHERRGGGTLKVMVICPGGQMREETIGELGYTFFRHRTIGTRADPARRVVMDRVLEKFAADDGDTKILAVRDAENAEYNDKSHMIDNMTGLDIDDLDVVLTIGRGSISQRMGRLCRLTRSTLSEKSRSALYIELLSVYSHN